MFRNTSCSGALKVLICAALTAAALATGATSAQAYGPYFYVPRPIVVVRPAPIVVGPPMIVVRPAPIVVSPVIVLPAPVVVQPGITVVIGR
jgi:hypothetical protein